MRTFTFGSRHHQVFLELCAGHDGVGYLPALLHSAQARGDYVEQITYLIFLTCLPIRRRQEMAEIPAHIVQAGEREQGGMPSP